MARLLPTPAPPGSCGAGPKVIFLTDEMFSIEPNMATSGTHDQKCSDKVKVYLYKDRGSVDKSLGTTGQGISKNSNVC